jgi:hypothetical protein
MLGRVRRTTRLDVGLSVGFAGVAYLVWALVAGTTRAMVSDLIDALAGFDANISLLTEWVRYVFVDAGVAIDVVGMVWLAGSLLLVVLSSRQRISISWGWLTAFLQLTTASLGAVLVSYDIHRSYTELISPMMDPNTEVQRTGLQQVSSISLAVSIPIAVLIWTVFLVWLLVERAHYTRRQGPTLRDALRTNIYR